MFSAGIQKLFCGIYSAFKCSFDEFVGEKVFSPSYSSAILAPLSESVLMRWMKMEPIIQSEVSQKEKHQYSILMHIYGI